MALGQTEQGAVRMGGWQKARMEQLMHRGLGVYPDCGAKPPGGGGAGLVGLLCLPEYKSKTYRASGALVSLFVDW